MEKIKKIIMYVLMLIIKIYMTISPMMMPPILLIQHLTRYV